MADLSPVLHAREAAVGAFAAFGGAPNDVADGLALASQATLDCCGEVDMGTTAHTWRAYARLLRALEQLLRWDAATMEAESEGDRFLRAAQRNAEVTLESLRDGEMTEIREALGLLGDIQRPTDIDACVHAASRIALPLLLLPLERPRVQRRPETPDAVPDPIVVVVLSIDGDPATDVTVVRPGQTYKLSVRGTVIDWPNWAERLEVSFLSVWAERESLPRFTLRPADRTSEGNISVTATDMFALQTAQETGAQPLSFAIQAEIVGGGRSEHVRVAGHQELL